VVAVKALLDRAGIPSVVPADILHEQWFKFMLNVGVNQVSAVLRIPFGAFGQPRFASSSGARPPRWWRSPDRRG